MPGIVGSEDLWRVGFRSHFFGLVFVLVLDVDFDMFKTEFNFDGLLT